MSSRLYRPNLVTLVLAEKQLYKSPDPNMMTPPVLVSLFPSVIILLGIPAFKLWERWVLWKWRCEVLAKLASFIRSFRDILQMKNTDLKLRSPEKIMWKKKEIAGRRQRKIAKELYRSWDSFFNFKMGLLRCSYLYRRDISRFT